MKANGHKSIKTQIINDRGIHICKSMVAWIKYGKGDTPKKSGLKGDQLVGKYYVIFEQVYKKQIASLISKGKSIKEAEKQIESYFRFLLYKLLIKQTKLPFKI